MFTPNWKAGDITTHEIKLDGGYICHSTVVHGDPADVPSVMRDLERITGYEFTFEGFTANEIERDLIAQGFAKAMA